MVGVTCTTAVFSHPRSAEETRSRGRSRLAKRPWRRACVQHSRGSRIPAGLRAVPRTPRHRGTSRSLRRGCIRDASRPSAGCTATSSLDHRCARRFRRTRYCAVLPPRCVLGHENPRRARSDTDAPGGVTGSVRSRNTQPRRSCAQAGRAAPWLRGGRLHDPLSFSKPPAQNNCRQVLSQWVPVVARRCGKQYLTPA
jgi:hypothetical protein